MRTIAHLSDLHFGSVDQRTLAPLVADLEALRPHLLVVSGDLTQRARASQFREARAFLHRIPVPQVVVPGNHDVPLFHLGARFFRPLGRWQRHFSVETEPFHADEEIAVAGVNSARSATFKSGRINREQVERLERRFSRKPPGVLKAIVTHHPFDLPSGHTDRALVGRARMAMAVLASCGVDLFFSGHLHDAGVGSTAERYHIGGHAAVVVHAGTSTSHRRRGQANSYNRVVVSSRRILVERRVFDVERGSFSPHRPLAFERGDDGWQPAEARAVP